MRLQYCLTAAFLAALCPGATGGLWAQEAAMAVPDSGRPAENVQSVAAGRQVYVRACITCHGNKGAGDGSVAFFLNRSYAPQPRDFTEGHYRFKSTLSGQPPLDEDLFRTVTRGVPGFMPGFGGLSPARRWQVVYYLKSLMPPGMRGMERQALALTGGPLPMTGASVQRGYELFERLQCWKCHGADGRGNGPNASELEDDGGYRVRPADLARPSSFKNGHRPEDIYRTIATGIDGTPMASFIDVLRGHESDIWYLVNYVRSLSEEEPNP